MAESLELQKLNRASVRNREAEPPSDESNPTLDEGDNDLLAYNTKEAKRVSSLFVLSFSI